MVIFNKAKADDFELTSQFYTYLFGVCRFIWDRKRKKMSNNNVTLPEDDRYISDKDIEQDIINRERHKIFQDNFSKLGAFCQKILKLFYDKKNMIDIAEQLDLKNEHTARTRKYRCQKKLEDFIKSDSRFSSFKV
jgi:RNA polymerase sigma factor (sigma-70 family)